MNITFNLILYFLFSFNQNSTIKGFFLRLLVNRLIFDLSIKLSNSSRDFELYIFSNSPLSFKFYKKSTYHFFVLFKAIIFPLILVLLSVILYLFLLYRKPNLSQFTIPAFSATERTDKRSEHQA